MQFFFMTCPNIPARKEQGDGVSTVAVVVVVVVVVVVDYI